MRELEILTSMSHPNIVHMHGVSYGTYFDVLVECENLSLAFSVRL